MTTQPGGGPPAEVDAPQSDDWQQRLRDQLAAAARRRESVAELRRMLAERRDAGLAARHAAKLQRAGDQIGEATEKGLHIPAQREALSRLRRAHTTGYRPTPKEQ